MKKDITSIDILAEKLLSLVWSQVPKITIAIITLVIGFWLANHLSSWLRRLLERRHTNPNIVPFLSSLISILIKILVLISVAAKFGIETTSFVAILGGAGLAVGLALQGNLSNFASGIMILVFKPFRINDNVVIAGHTGKVTEILIFNTVLQTPDNRKVIIPNNSITSSAIVNVSGNGELRTELNFKVSGAEDIQKVKALIKGVCDSNLQILKTRPLSVSVNTEDLAVSIFKVQVWSSAGDTTKVKDYLMEEIKAVFVANNVEAAG
jgi:small conductance mechanosensitive channel